MLSRPRIRLVAAAFALGVIAFAGQASFHSSGGHTYVVQPGDDLWRISQSYHVTVNQLAAANGMLPSDVLQIGRRLVIPGSASSSGGSSSGGSSGGRVVQPGDTLWEIAHVNGVSVAQLAAANGMSQSGVLPVGRHLVIPGSASSTTAVVTSSSSSAPPSSGAPAANPYFCETFTPRAGPHGVLPAQLAGSPDRLALRPLFVQWARHYGISPALLEAIAWQESGWQQGVVSSASAVGIGQIIPSTAQFINGQLVGRSLNVNSVSDNVRMSAAYLGWLQRVEGGSLCRTIAGYYQGAQNLRAYGVFDVTEPYVANVEALMPRFE